ncbi:MAG: DMT family transporter [Eubacteriales bacterium]|nr:DMT family transporter [Eubacteriales bacterium]
MKKKTSKGSILLPALLCTLLWGSAFPSVKSGYALFGIGDDPFSKLFFAGWRFMLAGVLVLIVYIVLYRKPFLPNRHMWRGILVLGLVQTTLQYVFFYIGLSHTTGVKGSVLTATTTFLSVLISHFLFPNDRLNRYKVVGCVLGFEGVILISMGSGDLFTGGIVWNGEGFMILSAAAAAIGAVISKLVARGAEPMVITGWQLFFGGAVLLVAGTAGGGHFTSTSPQAFALLGYMIFLSATAFTVWTILLKKHPVGKVTVYNFLVPVFGSLMSGLVLGEDVFTGRNIVSLLFVCAGIILVNLRTDSRSSEKRKLTKTKNEAIG